MSNVHQSSVVYNADRYYYSHLEHVQSTTTTNHQAPAGVYVVIKLVLRPAEVVKHTCLCLVPRLGVQYLHSVALHRRPSVLPPAVSMGVVWVVLHALLPQVELPWAAVELDRSG